MKKVRIFLLISLLLILSSTLMGCKGGLLRSYLIREVDKIEDGDFIYNITNYGDGDVCRIIGFSEDGFKKDEIVFPIELAGLKVYSLGNVQSEGWASATPINYFKNEKCNVKKVFIPANIYLRFTPTNPVFPNTEKAVFLSVYPNLHRVFDNKGEERNKLTNKYGNICVSDIIIVASKYKEAFDEYFNGIFIEANIQFDLNYEVDDLDDKMAQYAEELTEYCRINHFSEDYYNIKLNKYRHKVSNNEGIYWIDHLEVGCKLKTIPQNPTREGYTFVGWYFDKEGKEPADLTTVKPNKDGSTLFLYARWE